MSISVDHPCYRECKKGDSRVCEYNFTIEYNYILGKNCKDCPLKKDDCNLDGCIAADGVKRAIITINGRSPGPSIEVNSPMNRTLLLTSNLICFLPRFALGTILSFMSITNYSLQQPLYIGMVCFKDGHLTWTEYHILRSALFNRTTLLRTDFQFHKQEHISGILT